MRSAVARWIVTAACAAFAVGAIAWTMSLRGGTPDTPVARAERALRAAPTVMGYVRAEDGSAVEGAMVRLRDGARTIARDVSDADGAFRLEPPDDLASARAFRVWIEPPPGWHTRRTSVPVDAEGERHVDFVLALHARLAGRVVRADGTAFEGARLELVSPDGRIEAVKARDGGRFESAIGGPAGGWKVRVLDADEVHDVELVAVGGRLLLASGGRLVVRAASERALAVHLVGGPASDVEWRAELHALKGGGWAEPLARGRLVRGVPDRIVFPPFTEDEDALGWMVTLASTDGAWHANLAVDARAFERGIRTPLALRIQGRGYIHVTVHGLREGGGAVLRAVPLDDAATAWLADTTSAPPPHGVEGWIDASARRDLGPIAEGAWLAWVEIDGERSAVRRVDVRGGETAMVVLDAPSR